jgi:hypothetical protein
MYDDVGPPLPVGPDDVGLGNPGIADLDGFGAGFWAHARGEWSPIRLPELFAGRAVSFRIPYSMPGELIIPPNRSGVVFPEATFLHNVDKPFEIHRLVIRLSALGGESAASAVVNNTQPDTLSRRLRLRINDFSKNENLTKSATEVSQLLANNSGFWEFNDPYVLVRSEGFQVQLETQNFPTVCAPDPDDECQLVAVPMNFMRVEVSFQGYLIAVQPPSETR